MTLIIYDNSGRIFDQREGNYLKPDGGIQYLEVETPTDKFIKSVDVSVTPNIVVYEAYPITPIVELQERLEYMEGTINELLGV